MCSIYPNNFLENVVYTRANHTKQMGHFLDILQFFAKNGDLSLKKYEKGEIYSFDPLTRDRCCQIHSMAMIDIFSDHEISSEYKGLKVKIKSLLVRINRLKNRISKMPLLQDHTSLKEFVDNQSLSIEVSEKMQTLFIAHLLTFCTTPLQPRTIEYSNLQVKLSKKLDICTIQEAVSVCRSAISRYSTSFIQREAEKLNYLSKRLAVVRNFEIKEGDCVTKLTATSMFFNMKTILQILKENKNLLLIKEFRTDKQKPIGFCFRAQDKEKSFVKIDMAGLDPDEFVLTVKIKIEDNIDTFSSSILKESLEEILLTEASLCEQFVDTDDLTALEEDKEEIIHYRQSILSKNKKFSVIHVYPSRVKEECVV